MDQSSFHTFATAAADMQPGTQSLVSGKPEHSGFFVTLPVQMVLFVVVGVLITLLIDLLIGIL